MKESLDDDDKAKVGFKKGRHIRNGGEGARRAQIAGKMEEREKEALRASAPQEVEKTER